MLDLLRESKPVPENTLYTCLACHVAFPSSERQRTHYRTDWHKYNLKRKVADLAPVTAEQFAQKVLAQQAIGREEAERANIVYECGVCKRTYANENSFSNHLKSKKHRDLEFKPKITSTTILSPTTVSNNNIKDKTHRHRLFSDDEEIDSQQIDEPTYAADHTLISCLFCHHQSNCFDSNLQHMILQHSFFLPDAEYLMDAPGLVSYLAEKVMQDHICLYCNDRGRAWKSLESVRAHMIDKGHCKMAYDDSEDPEALLQFYDFGPIDLDSIEHEDKTLLNDDNELLLENGTKVGHRQRLRYFKQRLRRREAQDEKQQLLSIEAKEHAVAQIAELAQSEGNPLNRKQRRQLLLTDSANLKDPQTALTTIKSAQGQKEFSIKNDFHQQVSVKNNRNTLLRFRHQVPV
ncbi:C2H2 type zinc-finger-domain-containing protein [Cunninghamella echinulata]|nr:C2H2 type zinc-finger-domain-containing protein [Cunninghamella echinulata]